MYAFDHFRLDPLRGRLEREGRDLGLQRLRADALVTLVSRAGEVVPKEDLYRALWGESIVDFSSGLPPIIANLRSTLGDSAQEPRFIETVRGEGYRFIMPVAVEPDPDPSTANSERARWRWTVAATLLLAALLVFAALGLSRDSRRTRVVVQPFTAEAGLDPSNGASLAFVRELRSLAGETLEVVQAENSTARRWDFEVRGEMRRSVTGLEIEARLLDGASGETVATRRVIQGSAGLAWSARRLAAALFEPMGGTRAAVTSRSRESVDVLLGDVLASLQELRVSDALLSAEAAVSAAPDDARTWGTLALAHHDRWVFKLENDSLSAGLRAAEEAFRLDPEEPRALVAAAAFELLGRRQAKHGAELLRSALAAAPEEPRVWMTFSTFLLVCGEVEEAAQAARHLRALAQTLPLLRADVDWILWASGRTEEALESSRSAPVPSSSTLLQLHILEEMGRWEEMGRVARSYLVRRELPAEIVDLVVAAIEENSDSEPFWRLRIERLIRVAENLQVYPEAVAMSYAAAGDRQLAMAWLERGWETGSVWTSSVIAFPIFAGFEEEPRYRALRGEVDSWLARIPELPSVASVISGSGPPSSTPRDRISEAR